MPLVKPLCILLFLTLDQNADLSADELLEVCPADLIGDRRQLSGALHFDILRDLTGEFSSSCALACGVRKNMYLRESDLLNEAAGLLKLRIRFTRESDKFC